jgi:hypothetical protein
MPLYRMLLVLSSCIKGALLLVMLAVLPRWEPEAAAGAVAKSCLNKLMVGALSREELELLSRSSCQGDSGDGVLEHAQVDPALES